MQAMNSVLQKCVQNNINVFVSAGDNGSGDSINDGLAHVDFPGSSPWVVSCGGTTLQANISTNPPTIISETVWDNNPSSSATGGGMSQYILPPTYQTQNLIPYPISANPGAGKGRCVPDLSVTFLFFFSYFLFVYLLIC